MAFLQSHGVVVHTDCVLRDLLKPEGSWYVVLFSVEASSSFILMLHYLDHVFNFLSDGGIF